MTSPASRDAFRNLSRALNIRDAREVSVHLLRRLVAIIGAAPIEYADHNIASGGDSLSGHAVVFTDKLVIHAELKDAPIKPTDERGPSSVRIHVWARNTLDRLELPAGDGAGSDWAWNEEWNGPWPRDGRLELAYRNDKQLRLPLEPNGSKDRDVDTLLAALLHDLTV